MFDGPACPCPPDWPASLTRDKHQSARRTKQRTSVTSARSTNLSASNDQTSNTQRPTSNTEHLASVCFSALGLTRTSTHSQLPSQLSCSIQSTLSTGRPPPCGTQHRPATSSTRREPPRAPSLDTDQDFIPTHIRAASHRRHQSSPV
ncbi:hypothetical protein E2C01_023700 [Portunus trituberculatus]|uniref:Uncharacterized protein n=1 Tax=Portunus trituberculatus TaxID=210409 RepID=A0A5B7EAQ8_PORTR|nr:hypothetical protein [Portunus trituberculatus]